MIAAPKFRIWSVPFSQRVPNIGPLKTTNGSTRMPIETMPTRRRQHAPEKTAFHGLVGEHDHHQKQQHIYDDRIGPKHHSVLVAGKPVLAKDEAIQHRLTVCARQ